MLPIASNVNVVRNRHLSDGPLTDHTRLLCWLIAWACLTARIERLGTARPVSIGFRALVQAFYRQ